MTQQIVLALVVGTLVGWWLNVHFHAGGLSGAEKDALAARKANWLEWITLPRDIFLHLIKAMIGPLIFGSVVQGIAGTGDLRRVGRIGAKSIVYFEIMTTAALVIGLFMVNLIKPGAGIQLALELRQSARGIEVSASLHKGDYDQLKQHWPELQQRLEARGVRVGNLTTSESFTGAGHQQFNQSKQSSTQQDPLHTGAFAEFALAGAVTEAPAARAARTAAYRGWETWA